MKLLTLAVTTLIAFTGCKQEVVLNKTANTSGLVSKKSYAVVRCDNCKVVYVTPTKKQDLTISGVSPDLEYSYTPGKILKANIYPLDHGQDIIYTVYDTKGKIVYNNNIDQSTDDSWDVDVLLP